MSREIDNPPRTQFALTMIVGTLAIGIFGIAIDPSILMITMMSPVMASILITVWYAEFDRVPTKIVIDNDGIWLHFRRKRNRFVKWSEIDTIVVFPPDKNPFSGRLERYATLVAAPVAGKKLMAPMTFDAANAVIGAYSEALGKPPNVDWRVGKR